MCEDSGLVLVMMLLAEPSLLSNPGREAGLALAPNFLLGRDWVAGSVREPLPGARTLRSGFTFSFSAEERAEYNKFNRAQLLIKKVQRNMT